MLTIDVVMLTIAAIFKAEILGYVLALCNGLWLMGVFFMALLREVERRQSNARN